MIDFARDSLAEGRVVLDALRAFLEQYETD